MHAGQTKGLQLLQRQCIIAALTILHFFFLGSDQIPANSRGKAVDVPLSSMRKLNRKLLGPEDPRKFGQVFGGLPFSRVDRIKRSF